MPLVVPGLMNSKSKTEEWQHQLLGKKLSESTSEMTFAKKDLPKEHRVVCEGDMMTMDHNPNRLNIHITEDGTIQKVTHG